MIGKEVNIDSPRYKTATAISEYADEIGLHEVYADGEVYRIGKYYGSLFCTARILDGEIKVYGQGFIQIKFHTALRALPQKASYVFNSIKDAKNFLKLAFVDYKYDEALNIPQR